MSVDEKELPIIEQIIDWVEAWDEGVHSEDDAYNVQMVRATVAKLRAAEKVIARLSRLENDIHDLISYSDYKDLFEAVNGYERAGGSGE